MPVLEIYAPCESTLKIKVRLILGCHRAEFFYWCSFYIDVKRSSENQLWHKLPTKSDGRKRGEGSG
jgi:hypothetical protein